MTEDVTMTATPIAGKFMGESYVDLHDKTMLATPTFDWGSDSDADMASPTRDPDMLFSPKRCPSPHSKSLKRMLDEKLKIDDPPSKRPALPKQPTYKQDAVPRDGVQAEERMSKENITQSENVKIPSVTTKFKSSRGLTREDLEEYQKMLGCFMTGDAASEESSSEIDIASSQGSVGTPAVKYMYQDERDVIDRDEDQARSVHLLSCHAVGDKVVARVKDSSGEHCVTADRFGVYCNCTQPKACEHINCMLDLYGFSEESAAREQCWGSTHLERLLVEIGHGYVTRTRKTLKTRSTVKNNFNARLKKLQHLEELEQKKEEKQKKAEEKSSKRPRIHHRVAEALSLKFQTNKLEEVRRFDDLEFARGFNAAFASHFPTRTWRDYKSLGTPSTSDSEEDSDFGVHPQARNNQRMQHDDESVTSDSEEEEDEQEKKKAVDTKSPEEEQQSDSRDPQDDEPDAGGIPVVEQAAEPGNFTIKVQDFQKISKSKRT